MSVRRQTANRLTLFRTCGTCGKQIVTTADTPWVRQVERDGKKQATTYFCSEGCFAASYKHIGWFDGKAEERRKLKDRNRDPEKERARNRAYQQARRYDELILMLKAGQIRNLRLQQQYTLQESYITETGERVRAIHYVADFAYERPTAPDKYGTVFWLPVVEDVKSRATKTAQYEMKKKLLRERFNLTITEV